MDRLPQGAGALAVDDGHGLQLAHHGGGEEVFHHALRLQRLHPPDVQFPGGRGPQGPVGVLPDGDGGRLLPGGPLVVLDEPHLIRLGLHLQNTGLQLEGAVLAHRHHLRRLADTGELHQVPGPDGPAGLGDGLLPGVSLGHGLLRLVQRPPEGRPGLVLVEGPVRPGLGLPHFGELLEHLVRRGTGVPQDALGLCLAPAPGVVLGPLHLVPELPGLAGILLPLAQQAVRLLLPLLQRLALFLQLGQDVLEPDALAAHLLLGGGDDVLRQPQPPGDGKGVGLAGNADQQPVGGGQCLHVELAGGVLHPRRGHGEGL